MIAVAALAAPMTSIAQPAIKDVAGCWEIYGYPRDSRSLCIDADGRVRLVTHSYDGASKCSSYPTARPQITGGTISFDMPRGSRNCKHVDGAIGDSGNGKFVCALLNPARIACHLTWEGWKPTTELYRRTQDRVSQRTDSQEISMNVGKPIKLMVSV